MRNFDKISQTNFRWQFYVKFLHLLLPPRPPYLPVCGIFEMTLNFDLHKTNWEGLCEAFRWIFLQWGFQSFQGFSCRFRHPAIFILKWFLHGAVVFYFSPQFYIFNKAFNFSIKLKIYPDLKCTREYKRATGYRFTYSHPGYLPVRIE